MGVVLQRTSAAVLAGMALTLLATSLTAEPSRADAHAALTKIDPSFLVTRAEALEWHEFKDRHGPALSGNESWTKFMTYVEEKLREYGVVDVTRNSWTYDYWSTTEWPDDSNWSLFVEGQKVRVANYGANSGATGPQGITAPMVYYDHDRPPADIAGKIVVFEPTRAVIPIDDYEYYSSPTGRAPAPSPELQYQNNIRMNHMGRQLRPFIEQVVTPKKAAGVVFVMNANYERLKGYYTFHVPAIYQAPTVFVDRTVGESVVAAAKRGAPATIKLVATVRPVTTWQLIAYLPGKDYGTDKDEIIQLTTHSDGPSISQDNGPFGLLGVVKYFSRIPQSQRPRTLLVFMDNRHYMPGMEHAFEQHDWFHKHPQLRARVKAVIGMEHLGQMEFFEDGEKYVPTGRADDVRIWVTNNQKMIDMTIKAVKDNQLPNAYVRNVDRPGVQGKSQGSWLGLAGWARREGIPAMGIMGDLDAYWTTSARIDRFDADLFVKQVATVAQLTGELMLADFAELQAPEIRVADERFEPKSPNGRVANAR